MSRKTKRNFYLAGIFFAIFIAYTFAVKFIDVAPIGPENSSVGFSTINQLVFSTLGQHKIMYDITKVLGLFALVVAAFFVLLTLLQLIRYKSISHVDASLIALIIHYATVAIAYVAFEFIEINYRPVILDEGLEASYPSTHTMLALCIMLTAILQFRSRFNGEGLKNFVTILFLAIAIVTVVGRLLSGVHWFTDILGGVILSAALVMFYIAMERYLRKRRFHEAAV